MATIHIAAEKSDFAKTVLMPGDPVRAEFIAKTFLTSARLVSDVRRICAYTGEYEGKPVSVMASGMGAGSMGIYSWELLHFFDVESIIRVGSAGGLGEDVKLGDVVVGLASSTDTGYAAQFNLPGTVAPTADWSLVEKAVQCAAPRGVPVKVGTLFCGEAFYYGQSVFEQWRDMGALAVEMESAALYLNAAHAKKKAVALCTVSDHMFTGEAYSPKERETSFCDMITVALDMAE